MAIFLKTLERDKNGKFPVYDSKNGVFVYPKDNHFSLAMALYKMSKKHTLNVAQTLLSFDEKTLQEKYNKLCPKTEEKKPKAKISEEDIIAKAKELCEGDMLFAELKANIKKAKDANDSGLLEKLKEESNKFFNSKMKEAEKILKAA